MMTTSTKNKPLRNSAIIIPPKNKIFYNGDKNYFYIVDTNSV